MNWSNRIREVPKQKILKAFGGVVSGHGTGTGFSILGFRISEVLRKINRVTLR
jgi:hypothetical protein